MTDEVEGIGSSAAPIPTERAEGAVVSGHTPGPWAIRRGHSVVEVRTTAGLPIAATTGSAYWENFSEEALTNARLIAAAPDLLEAAWALVEHFERVDGDARHKAVVSQATAAIAKALGQPPISPGEQGSE